MSFPKASKDLLVFGEFFMGGRPKVGVFVYIT